MSYFICPQCRAEVTKKEKAPLGCPCCGYAVQGVAPFVPIVWPRPPNDLPVPCYPTWVINPNTWVSDPKITWTTSNTLTAKPNINSKVTFTCGPS